MVFVIQRVKWLILPCFSEEKWLIGFFFWSERTPSPGAPAPEGGIGIWSPRPDLITTFLSFHMKPWEGVNFSKRKKNQNFVWHTPLRGGWMVFGEQKQTLGWFWVHVDVFVKKKVIDCFFFFSRKDPPPRGSVRYCMIMVWYKTVAWHRLRRSKVEDYGCTKGRTDAPHCDHKTK